MLRTLCDRCGADTTAKKSAAVAIIGDADIHGNGSVTRTADLCIKCRDTLIEWLTPDVPRSTLGVTDLRKPAPPPPPPPPHPPTVERVRSSHRPRRKKR